MVTISGLSPDEKYIFAVAAYDSNGQLISNTIGDSTEPILASNTLSILMNWAFLCQVCYQINEYNIALTAFEMLWKHFIIEQVTPESETIIYKNQVDFEVSFHQFVPLNFQDILVGLLIFFKFKKKGSITVWLKKHHHFC